MANLTELKSDIKQMINLAAKITELQILCIEKYAKLPEKGSGITPDLIELMDARNAVHKHIEKLKALKEKWGIN